MTSPIEQAKALTPFWMMDIKRYEGLEVHPVRDMNWNAAEQGPRPFSPEDGHETRREPCQPHEAQFWSVYGRAQSSEIVCFEDFATEDEAYAFAEKLLEAYPHLREKRPPEQRPRPGLMFYAQPYDISATGFYFRSREEYNALRLACRGDTGLPVEEFEIQFIDGETLDAYFADAFGLNQVSVFRIIALIEEWDEDAKRRFIIAVGECGYSFDPETVDPDDFEVEICESQHARACAAICR